ncbi:MAG TPA: hypothetical protein VFW98_13010 [Gemmatimonadaceae bacterium]|nr:hypothetical protein [Gemmatimonadaceae bacterium]
MSRTTTIAQMLIRITGILLIILGLLFWSGHALGLIGLHMLLGLVLVVSLWVLAGVGARAGVGSGFVGLAIVWGVIVLVLGMTQARLLPGSAHWVIQALHLLVGLAAMGIGESLAKRIQAARTPALQV